MKRSSAIYGQHFRESHVYTFQCCASADAAPVHSLNSDPVQCTRVLQHTLYHFEQPTPTEHLQILNYGYYRPLEFQRTQLSGLEQS